MWDQDAYERMIGKKRPTRREIWEKIAPRIKVCQHVARPPFTLVTVFVQWNHEPCWGYGFSKQNRYGPTADEWNEQEGFNHAFGRAKKDLLDTIMKALKGEG